jgi:hypothetical protein
MKPIYKLSLILMLAAVLVLAFPGTALAQRPSGDQVVFGGQYTLREGDILNGNLVVFGGSATLEEGSRVTGSIAVMGGSLDVNGEVNGSINIIGGSVFLGDTAHVRGDIVTVGGSVTRQPGARVDGSSRQADPEEFRVPQITRPGVMRDFGNHFRPIGVFLWFVFQTLALSALAVLVALFLLRPTQRVAETIVAQPVISGAAGFLTLLVAPALMIVLAITIILIPISLLGFLALVVALVFGWIAFGLEVGQRLAALFKANWSAPVSAGLGTLVLTTVAGALGQIPCIGWVLNFLVAMIGLGAVVMSRFGTRTYLGEGRAAPPPPPPVVPVTPPPPPPPVTPVTSPPPPQAYQSGPAPVEPAPESGEEVFGDPFERPTPPEEDPTGFPPDEPQEDDARRGPPEEPLP